MHFLYEFGGETGGTEEAEDAEILVVVFGVGCDVVRTCGGSEEAPVGLGRVDSTEVYAGGEEK